ncbi:MAG: hypothetical protein OEZ22_04065 [Spirochaetia bacterium]|nr:hypothetical protein [Spirochaetia bacterium]
MNSKEQYPKKCPHCGERIEPLSPINKKHLIKSIAIGTVAGTAVGAWFVTWWFEGMGFNNMMAVVHLISGAVLGALAGWGASSYSKKS